MKVGTDTVTAAHWSDANRQYLLAWVRQIRRSVERLLADASSGASSGEPSDASAVDAFVATPAWPEDLPNSALDVLCELFRLSPFERDLLVLCAGVELHPEVQDACMQAGGLTFGLALAALDRAHWDAIAPSSPLRYWHLIEVGPGATLTGSTLRIDERILHYLMGLPHVDERVSRLGEFPRRDLSGADGHVALAEQIARTWNSSDGAPWPVAHLIGDDPATVRQVATEAAARVGLAVMAMPAASLPVAPADLELFVRLWQREVYLCDLALLIEVEPHLTEDGATTARVARVADLAAGSVVMASCPRGRLRTRRALVAWDVPALSRDSQRQLWRTHLLSTQSELESSLDRVLGQFRFQGHQIRAISSRVAGQLTGGDAAERGAADTWWDACRAQSRLSLDNLAQAIEPRAEWDDLIAPDEVYGVLREIEIHVRQRATVYLDWGFAGKSGRGLGVSALFAGPSGTGKTMAAEVLARTLGLDLYRIDLSSVVSKYIGETEKNLSRIFDVAHGGGAILLFDEADALFGKRSEVKDSHDRYANIEVSYLLQRMESYEGLAILTTNLRDSLDHAFVRRLRFIVEFPYPDAAQRQRIWQRIFPSRARLGRLDWKRLARLNITGGNIRNIALSAAMLAADADEPITMKHLLQAARGEFRKLNRPLHPAEIEGWEEMAADPAATQRDTAIVGRETA